MIANSLSFDLAAASVVASESVAVVAFVVAAVASAAVAAVLAELDS